MKKLVGYNSLKIFLVCLLINSLVTAMSLSIPYLEGEMIDAVVAHIWTSFMIYAGLNILFHIAIQFAYYWADIWQGRSELYVWQFITRLTEENILKHNPTKSDLSESRIMQELGQSYEMIRPFFNAYPIKLLLYAVRALVIIIVLAVISPVIAGLVVVLIPIFILISRKYANRLSEVNAAVVDDMKDARDYLVDKSKLSAVERFTGQSKMQAFSALLNRYQKDKVRQVKTNSVFENFLSYAFLNLMILLTAIISAYQAFKGQMTIGEFFAVQLYVSQFWSPVEFFLDIYKEYAGSKKIIDSFLEFLSPENIDYKTSEIREIRLEDYIGLDRDGQELHQPLTVTLRTGRIYQIIARNGGGKTRLVTAILGLHKQYKGTISYNLFPENRNLAYCPAEPVVSRFYESELNRGASMGQLKLFQLEQILSEEKAVYIFDEPTNFLDAQHRQDMMNRIRTLKDRGKIVLFISHDLSVEDAEIIRLG